MCSERLTEEDIRELLEHTRVRVDSDFNQALQARLRARARELRSAEEASAQQFSSRNVSSRRSSVRSDGDDSWTSWLSRLGLGLGRLRAMNVLSTAVSAIAVVVFVFLVFVRPMLNEANEPEPTEGITETPVVETSTPALEPTEDISIAATEPPSTKTPTPTRTPTLNPTATAIPPTDTPTLTSMPTSTASPTTTATPTMPTLVSPTVPTLIAPAVPNLVSPTSGSTVYDVTPRFEWDDVANATKYQFQVDDNSDFSSPVLNVTITGTAYTPTSELARGTYYWRVQAGVGNLWGAHSEAWTAMILLCGDVNSDGVVNIVDALLTDQYSAGMNPSGFDPKAADVNEDGTVNNIDALLISHYYVGNIPELPWHGAVPEQ